MLLSFSLGCNLSHGEDPAQTVPPDGPDGDCPHWFLVERDGGENRYTRYVYDEQMRVVRAQHKGVARSETGESHQVVETEYTSGRVSWSRDVGGLLEELDGVIEFSETTELDELNRPIRILGRDSQSFRVPNRVETREYDGDRLVFRHQQDTYANGATVDNRCTYEYEPRGLLTTVNCSSGNVTRFGWDDEGNLSFRDLMATTFTSRQDYTYGEGRITNANSSFRRQEFAYDDDGRLIRSRSERLDGLGGGLSEYEYDESGRVRQHIAKELDGSTRNTTTFTFDADGRLIEAASGLTPRSYAYEQTEGSLIVRESRGANLVETRHYICSQVPTTGVPLIVDPDPAPNGDRVLPDQTVLPQPFPTALTLGR